MLSTLALKSGTFGRLALKQRCLPALLVTSRSAYSTDPFETGKVEPAHGGIKIKYDEIEEEMTRWEVANEVYFGKDRDTKNFPHMPIPEKCPPVKFGILPESWFTAMYNKTGVSGPYLLTVGLVGTLFSKEYLVIDHGMMDMLFFPVLAWLAWMVGDKVNAWATKSMDKNKALTYTKPMTEQRNKIAAVVDTVEQDIWRKEGQKYAFETMKENVALQLEAAYRQRMNKVYTDVKRRLDYQLEIQNASRRFEQENMVNWITNNVVSSITPQQEKESLASCIQTLKRLSQTQAAV